MVKMDLNSIKKRIEKILELVENKEFDIEDKLDAIKSSAEVILASISLYNDKRDPELFAIPANAHTDDYMHVVQFDAEEFFKKATTKQLIDLIECEFGGDYASDAVVESMKGKYKDIDDLFAHTSGDVGFECYVNKDEAIQWILNNRPNPELIEKIQDSI